MSIEALAMAGADYKDCKIVLQSGDSSPRLKRPLPPPNRLAERMLTISVDSVKRKSICSTMGADHNILLRPVVVDGDHMKAKIREWAKAVVLSTI
ncbi:hypothetical protein PanWU01x14_242800 [Parasponia andersonii]|uniref:Uncharacterized protein n=1 Tax=Parasponia andersonii TaxID=3476 RepID=A0A2P5BFX3_PARAD|nr:hypothetical protein PanWU01x14_242800 [Parasponia andersonii]